MADRIEEEELSSNTKVSILRPFIRSRGSRLTFETTKVLTSITQQAAITIKSDTMFMARKTLRIAQPGPARDFLMTGMMIEMVCCMYDAETDVKDTG